MNQRSEHLQGQIHPGPATSAAWGRSTWQVWHVRAEAQGQIRTADVPVERASALMDLLVDAVLDHRCVALAAPADNVGEPGALRRLDGSSVYTVAGTDLYTSQRILDAEQRLVAAAGRRDGSAVDGSAVDGSAGDGGEGDRTRCRAGGAGPPDVHVRARLELAVAPAGAGKTTAMRALTLAWTDDGSQVIGLAPSAAAAAVLAEQTSIRADTSPNSPGPYSTATCRTGRQRSGRRRW